MIFARFTLNLHFLLPVAKRVPILAKLKKVGVLHDSLSADEFNLRAGITTGGEFSTVGESSAFSAIVCWLLDSAYPAKSDLVYNPLPAEFADGSVDFRKEERRIWTARRNA